MAVMQEVLVVSKVKRSTISISQLTKDSLDSIKHPGQSYEGVIKELIKLWGKEYGAKILK